MSSSNNDIYNAGGPGSSAEPSMEEILASIRRILKEDDTPEPPPVDLDDDILVLDQSMIVRPADLSSATMPPEPLQPQVEPAAKQQAVTEPVHFSSEPVPFSQDFYMPRPMTLPVPVASDARQTGFPQPVPAGMSAPEPVVAPKWEPLPATAFEHYSAGPAGPPEPEPAPLPEAAEVHPANREPAVQPPEPVAQTPEPVVQTPEPVAQTPEPVVQTPEPVIMPEPVMQTPEPAAPPPEPEIFESLPEILPEATPAEPDMSDQNGQQNVQPPQGLMSDKVADAAASSIGAMVRSLSTEKSVAVNRTGLTIEDIVREEIRPLLKSWLDSHLPSLVERVVRSEIERVIDRSSV